MSTKVDERVVTMEFDNKRFEKNIQTSIESIKTLEKSLQFTEASKGFGDITRAANGVDMSAVANGVSTVSSKFSAMSAIAFTALQNITNKAINAGERIARSLTIEPIKLGLTEYEQKMGSIQTIMASTGEKLSTVNGYLNELNEYSDKTIYSFSDMTNNIGKFTNAGVKLEDAVLAIKGISNEAALSGANANEASRAMYNFSQALSAGYVKLIDWKSIENANMATVGFKQELINAAVAAGKLTKTGDGMYRTLNGTVMSATKNFNETLQEQWMTSDVLIKTLKNYADENSEIGKKAYAAAQDVKTFTMMMDTLKESAQSGWAQTFEIIFGNLEEAKILWTGLSNAIGGFINSTSDARNKLLQGWKDMGGRDDLIQTFINLKDVAMDVITPIKEAFRDIIPPLTAEKLAGITAAIRNFTSHLKMSEKTQEALKSTFKGVFAVVEIVGSALWNLVKILGAAIKYLWPVIELVLRITGAIGNLIVKLRDVINQSKAFSKIAKVFKDVMQRLEDTISKFVNFIDTTNFKELGKNIVQDLSKGIKAFMNDPIGTIKALFNNIVNGAKSLLNRVSFKEIGKNIVQGLSNGIKSFFNDPIAAIKSLVTKLVNGFKDMLGIHSPSKVFEGFGKDTIAGFVKGLGEAVKTIFTFLTNLGRKIGTWFTEKVFPFLKEAFANFDLKSFLETLNEGLLSGVWISLISMINGFKKTISSGGGSISGFLSSLKTSLTGFIDSFGSIGRKIASMLDEVRGCFEAYQKNLKAQTLMTIAKAIAILVAALVVLAFIKPEKLTAGVAAITLLFVELTGAMRIMMAGLNKMRDIASLTSVGSVMLSLAGTMLLMAVALRMVANMEPAKLIMAAVSLTGLMVAMTGMMAWIQKFARYKKAWDQVKGVMRSMSITLVIMAVALKIAGSMSWDQMLTAVLGLSGVLVVMTGMMAWIQKFATAKEGWDKARKTMGSMTGMLLVMSVALKIAGTMSWDQMLTAVLGLTGVMAAMVGVMAWIQKFATAKGGWDKAQKSMWAMAGVMAVVSIALKIIATIPFGRMMGSILGIAVVLGALVGAMAVITHMPDDTKGVKQLLALAGVLATISIALRKLAKTDFPKLMGAVLGIVAVLGVLIGAMAIITHIPDDSKGVKQLLALAGVLAVITVALRKIAKIDFGAMMGAVVGITLVLGALVGALYIVEEFSSLKSAVGIFVVTSTLLEVALALRILAGLDIPSMLSAVVGLGACVAMIAVLLKIFENMSSVSGAVAIAIVSASIIGLAASLAILAALDFGSLMGAVLGLVVAMGALAGIAALLGMIAAPALIGAGVIAVLSVSMMMMAGALTMLVPALAALSLIDLGAVASGLIKLCGALALLSIVSILSPLLLVMSTAVSLLGIGILSLGIGLTLVTTAMVALATIGVPGATAALAVMSTLVTGLIALLPKLIAGIVKSIGDSAIDIANTIVKLGLTILEAIGALAGPLFKLVGTLLDGLIDLLVKYIPKFVVAAVQIVAGILQGIADNIGKVVEAGTNLVISFLRAIAEQHVKITEAGFDIIIKFCNGMADTIREKTPELIKAATNLGSAIVEGVGQGIGAMLANPIKMIKTLGNNIIKGFKEQLGIHSPSTVFADIGKNIIQGLINGITGGFKSVASALKKGISGAVSSVKKLLGIKSPSRVFMGIGEYMDQGLVKGLESYSGKVTKASENVGTNAVNSMNRAVSGIADAVNSDIDSQPTIRPVLDLSNIESGASAISGMFGMRPSVGVMANVGSISSSMNKRQNGVAGSETNNNITNNYYTIDGVTYDDGSNIAEAIKSIVQVARIERRA